MPYHRRYHGDALQGYRKLTLEERGAYSTILDLIYDEGGAIDYNERWLAGELNCSIRLCRSLLSALLTKQKIYITSTNKIGNRRADTELENSLKISRKRAENGSKRGPKVADYSKTSNEISPRLQQMLSNSSVIPEPEPDKENYTGTEEYPSGARATEPERDDRSHLAEALNRGLPGRDYVATAAALRRGRH